MRFFIPNAPSDAEAEKFYEMNKDFNRKFNPFMVAGEITERRIFSITVLDEEAVFTAEVGQEFREFGIVMSILEAGNFLICTVFRGAMDGEPILVHPDEVLSVVDFD